MGGPQSRSGEEKNLSGIEPRFLSCPTHSLTLIPNDLSWLHVYLKEPWLFYIYRTGHRKTNLLTHTNRWDIDILSHKHLNSKVGQMPEYAIRGSQGGDDETTVFWGVKPWDLVDVATFWKNTLPSFLGSDPGDVSKHLRDTRRQISDNNNLQELECSASTAYTVYKISLKLHHSQTVT
jgi:hypothetical protein